MTFNGLNVYSHSSLRLSTARSQATELLLLGYIINPLNPKDTDADIVRNIADRCHTTESLFIELQSMSGRFVLLYKNASDFIAVTDACSLRQLYYGFIEKTVVLTSSVKMFLDLFGSKLEISDLEEEFINLNEYRSNEFARFGDKSIDKRLMKVLPNHFLDLNTRRIARVSLYYEKTVCPRDALEYTCSVLEGSINALVNRYEVFQPLTAGWDSRALLAASKRYKDSIQFYVMDFWKGIVRHPDVWVPIRLSAKLGVNLQIITPEEIRADFQKAFRKEHLFPRMGKTAEIQYHYYNNSERNVIRVSGIGGEVLRCNYGYTNRSVDLRMLLSFSGYSENTKLVSQEIASWFRNAREYSREYGIPLLDLFYWEQRLGNWGALFPFEQDIAIEEGCPFCNRNLILSILAIKSKKRSPPKYVFFNSLISHLWTDTLTEPINPMGSLSYLRMASRRYSMLRYYKKRAQDFFQFGKTKK